MASNSSMKIMAGAFFSASSKAENREREREREKHSSTLLLHNTYDNVHIITATATVHVHVTHSTVSHSMSVKILMCFIPRTYKSLYSIANPTITHMHVGRSLNTETGTQLLEIRLRGSVPQTSLAPSYTSTAMKHIWQLGWGKAMEVTVHNTVTSTTKTQTIPM